MFTIVVGNPWDGMYLVGLFDDFDSAEAFAYSAYSDTEWWIKDIQPID